MSRDRLLRSSGLVAIMSGVVLLLLALTLVAARLVPGIPDLVFVVLRLGAHILVVFALLGLYFALSPWSGRLGQVGIAVAVIGLLIFMANFYPGVGWLLFLGGLFLFAVASTRAGLRTSPGLWLWLIGSCFAFIMAALGWPVLVALGVLLSGCGQIWLGCSARCERAAIHNFSGPQAPMPAR